MLLTAQHGVHVLPIMLDTPVWAGATLEHDPADPSAYATFVAAVVARYGPHGSFWTQHPDARGLRDPDLRALERALLLKRQRRRL